MDLHPPEGMGLEAVVSLLSGALSLQVGAERRRDVSFYDTFDGLLHEAGRTLAHESGRLELRDADTGAAVASAPMRRPVRPLAVSDLAPGALRDALHDVADVRALLRIARLDCRERVLDVLDDEHKTVLHLTLTSPAVSQEGAVAVLATRVTMAPLRGYRDEHRRVRALLSNELGFRRAAVALLDEAVRASGRDPAGVTGKPVVALSGQMAAGEAVAGLLGAQLAVIEANLPGAMAEIDTEFLHDLRVAVRRSRAVQRQFKTVFDPDELAGVRREFTWLQQVTGDARDLDVYLLGFEAMRELIAPGMRGDLEPVVQALRARHRLAHAAMRRQLRSPRTQALLQSWRACLDGLAQGRGGPDVSTPVAQLAGRRIRKVYRRMIAMGGDIRPGSPAEDYHALRKKGKELRYLLELFGAQLYPGDVVKPLVKTLKSLQDVLGHHQDREVQAATLRGLTEELAMVPGGPQALVALGALIQRLGEDEQAARAEFSQRFEPFSARAQRRLVKETFR